MVIVEREEREIQIKKQEQAMEKAKEEEMKRQLEREKKVLKDMTELEAKA